ncbi:abscission/NoCut checkpoint regulator isoform X2 [Coccinella septempunctata]|nr:abscission/NoCut checkpoint regulator isoform X2 [Coccinella septempunctata]
MKIGLTPADQKLVDRLEKLKDEKNKSPPPSETELRRRLAQLKGENFIESSAKNLLPSVDNRTHQEKVDGLLDQYTSERDIEFQHNPQEEIEARLATLREQGVRPNEGTYMSNLHDSDDSEEEIGKITKKIMDEVALEQATHPQLSNKNSNTSDKSDKSLEQWCALCNKDPKFRCFNHIMYDTGTSRHVDESFLQHFLIERDIHLLHKSEDIEQRLAELRDQDVEKSSCDGPLLSSLPDSSNSDSVDFMVRKVMDEVALEEKTKASSSGTEGEPDESLDDTEVLPWCVLCNEDAHFRCLDCGDLYCSKCNKEVHKQWDRDHKVVAFTRK